MGRINFRSGIWTCDREGANSAAEVVPPYRMLKFRFSLSQDQIPLRKLFLPIAGTNPAEEIVPPYNRYNFRSSLTHSSGICSCDREEQLPQQNLYLLFLPITGTTYATELAPALGLSGSCTCNREEQFNPYHRKISLRGLLLPIALQRNLYL